MSRRQPPREQQYRPLTFKRGAKGVCPSGKLRYASSIDAAIALANAQRARHVKGRDAVVEQRHYRCPTCSGWHLTSKPAVTPKAS